MKNRMMSILAIFFPWIILLQDDNPTGAFLAMALQVTLIGWIPASMWALRVAKKQQEQKEREAKKAAKEKQTHVQES